MIIIFNRCSKCYKMTSRYIVCKDLEEDMGIKSSGGGYDNTTIQGRKYFLKTIVLCRECFNTLKQQDNVFSKINENLF